MSEGGSSTIDHLEALETLYAAVEAALPAQPTNPCGTCRACCTGRGVTGQSVMAIEIAALARRFGEDRAEAFRVYAGRERDAQGMLRHEDCPFYDHGASGCSIHAHRPYSCRTFGHFRMINTRLPDGCVFEPIVREVDQGEYFRALPRARELRDLARHWDARRPSGAAAPAITEDVIARVRANIDPDDPADLGMLAQLEGHPDEALAHYDRAADQRPHDAHVHFSRATVLDGLRRNDEARAAYERAVALDASNPRAWLHLGMAQVEAGLVPAARDAFAHAVALQPEDAASRGFLGYLTLALARSIEEIREASEHLAAAVRLAPQNALYRLRLAETLLLQGQSREAQPHLQAAAADARVAAAVAAVREQFKALLDLDESPP